jgi:hypothetical protein
MSELYAVKYLADPLRREPKNVGLLVAENLEPGANVASRFVGEKDDGGIRRNALHDVPDEVYQRWINYYRRKAATGRWDDIARLERKRPSSFYLDHLLTILDDAPVDRVLDQYYSSVVTERPRRPLEADRAQGRVRQIFEELHVKPHANREFTGVVNGEPLTVRFGYEVVTDRTFLMDWIPTSRQGRQVETQSEAYAFRATAVRGAGLSDHFAAFADLSGLDDDAMTNELRAAANVGEVIDIHDFTAAVDKTAQILGV